MTPERPQTSWTGRTILALRTRRFIGSMQVSSARNPRSQDILDMRPRPARQRLNRSSVTAEGPTETAIDVDKRAVYKDIYRPDDDEFWSRYEEIWGAAADAVFSAADDGGNQDHPRQTTRTTATRRVSSKEKRSHRKTTDTQQQNAVPKTLRIIYTQRRPTTPRHEVFMGQVWYLRRSTPPGDFARAHGTFRIWKQALDDTWKKFEAAELPDPSSESYLLRSLLAQDERRGATEDTVSHPTLESIQAAWQRIPESRRRTAWPSLMMAALRAHPASAYTIFLATFDAALVPSYLAQDVIHYLIRQHRFCVDSKNSKQPPTISINDLYRLLEHVLANSRSDYLRLQQSTIYFYVRSLPDAETVARLYDILVDVQHPLHKHTRLQIAGRLAVSSTHKIRAIDVLRDALAATDLDLHTPQGAALCTSILSMHGVHDRVAESGSVSSPSPAEMFELLLDCGLKPNLITYTTILRDLCLAGELDAAQQVLQVMVTDQSACVEPDAYVYSTLLNGAKLSGHVPLLRQVATAAAAQGVFEPIVWNDFLQALHSTVVASVRGSSDSGGGSTGGSGHVGAASNGSDSGDVVHARFSRPGERQGRRVVPAFPLMLQAYAKLFAHGPLRTLFPEAARLGLDRSGGGGSSGGSGDATLKVTPNRWGAPSPLSHTVQYELPQLAAENRMQPTGSTLASMVLGYIHGLSSPYDVVAFYAHFRRLLQAGDAVATMVVRDQGSFVHDAVVLALCEFEGMLRVALDVVGDMLRGTTAHGTAAAEGTSPPEATTTTAAETNGPSLHPPPSVYTWSILLRGFMMHRQAQQAEHILHMMRQRRVLANHVTWNTLIAGYARQQNVRKTAGALQRMERAGMEPDDYTLRAFSYIRNKSAVLAHLNKARHVRNGQEPDNHASTPTSKTALAVTAHAHDGDCDGDRLGRIASAYESNALQPQGAQGRSMAATLATSTVPAHELCDLEHEIEEMARMMDDEEQKHGKGAADASAANGGREPMTTST